MTKECECCGKPLEMTFARTRFCNNCAVFHTQTCNEVGRLNYKIQRLEKELRLAHLHSNPSIENIDVGQLIMNTIAKNVPKQKEKEKEVKKKNGHKRKLGKGR